MFLFQPVVQFQPFFFFLSPKGTKQQKYKGNHGKKTFNQMWDFITQKCKELFRVLGCNCGAAKWKNKKTHESGAITWGSRIVSFTTKLRPPNTQWMQDNLPYTWQTITFFSKFQVGKLQCFLLPWPRSAAGIDRLERSHCSKFYRRKS